VTQVAEVALFTDDVAAVSAFYGELVGTPPVAVWPGGAVFDVGGSKILVHERSAALEDGPPNEDHFALAVEDLDAKCNALVAGARVRLVELSQP